LRIARRGLLTTILKSQGYELILDGEVVRSVSGTLDPQGSYGPFEWRSVDAFNVRGPSRGFLVQAEGIKILYLGNVRGVRELPEADVLILSSGGNPFMDPLDACEIARGGPWRAYLPIGVWEPGIKAHFDTFNMIRAICKGFKRIRVRSEWKVTFDPLKKALVLLSARSPSS
jgi:hypothetical protein